MRQFFLTFPDGSAVPVELGGPPKRLALPSESGAASGRENRSALPSESGAEPMFPPNLGWTHYAILMRVANPSARSFYEIEAVREAPARQGWTNTTVPVSARATPCHPGGICGSVQKKSRRASSGARLTQPWLLGVPNLSCQ